MKIGIVHLSDIHINGKYENEILRRANLIVDSVANVDIEVSTIVLLVTGDIAFSGQKEEYDLFENFLVDLLDRIEKIEHITDTFTFFTPGNHDCDFSEKDTIRSLILDKICTDPSFLDSSMIDGVTKAQSNYGELARNYHDLKLKKYEHPCVSVYTIPAKNNVTFRLINTAWMSQLKEVKGMIHYPLDLLGDLDKETGIVLSCFHHPYSWLSEECSRKFRQLVESSSDIVFTGHEHDCDCSQVIREGGLNVNYIEGGMLHNVGQKDQSEFNYVVLDVLENKALKSEFSYNGEIYSSKPPYEFPSLKNKLLLKNVFNLSDEFYDYLNDPGANFNHPAKSKLSLADIFTYPRLTVNKIGQPNTEKQTGIKSQNVEQYFLDTDKAIVTGQDKCGKTTLIKMITKLYAESNYVVNLVDCCTVANKKAINCFNKIRERVKELYHIDNFEKIEQLNKNKRVIVLDNFHRLKCSPVERADLIILLERYYCKIILTCDELFNIEELKYENNVRNPLLSYERSAIRPFGKLLRERLIQKWLMLDPDVASSPEEFVHITATYSNLIDSFFGSKLLPYFPLFILIIVQQFHSSKSLDNANGTYGQLYEMLINQALAECGGSVDTVTKITYLSKLAYIMFESEKRVFSYAELQKFHIDYCQFYKETFGVNEILSSLLSSSIITDNDLGYSFKYNYFYYYFCAKYIASKFSNEDSIKEKVSHMTKHVYIDEYANLLLFLSYLSDHKEFILKEIVGQSKALYEDYKPCDLDKDIDFINKLSLKAPKVAIGNDADGNESREQALRRIDKLEDDLAVEPEDKMLCHCQSREEVDELDDVLRMSVAFRTIDILGQILRNFSGALSGDIKHNIAGECYELAFRTIMFFVKTIEDNLQNISEDLSANIRENNKDLSESKIQNNMNLFIFEISALLSLGIIQKVSSSIGIEKLELVYADIRDQKPTIANKLMDLAIKLENFKKFPELDVLSLFKELRKNMLAQTVTRIMVVQRFEMKPSDRNTRNKVCSKLQIALKPGTLAGVLKD